MTPDPDIRPTRVPSARGDHDGPVSPGVLGPGDLIDGYRVERIVGAGGMGVVYQAEERELGRRVALKIIAPERALDPVARALFTKEASAAAAVEHPNILPVYRTGETDLGQPYLTMRFVDGPSLRELLASSGPLPSGRASGIASDIASALAAAHAVGLLHRDVKPGNVLIAAGRGRDHAYLADFGISAAAAPPGAVIGTEGYLAPEVAEGGPASEAADVYALGRVVLECLVQASRPLMLDPRAALERTSQAPMALREIVLAALSDNPGDRPSASDFARAAASSRHDLVLIHHDADAAVAEDVASVLRRDGLDVVAGGASGHALYASASCAVLVGIGGIGRWAREAISAANDMARRDPGFGRLVVTLPGSPNLQDRMFDAVTGWPGLRLHAARSRDEVVSSVVRSYRPRERSQGIVGQDETCPYPGLESFDEASSPFFVGREEECAELVESLRDGRFVAVLAPSGYGKTSLLQAGLIPALRNDVPDGKRQWRIAMVTPGDHPAARIAASLSELDGVGPLSGEALLGSVDSIDNAIGGEESEANDRVLLICDQFEEIFTLCNDEAERGGVIAALVHAATIPGGRAVLVLAMRADFYPRLAPYESLRALVAAHQLLVGPLRGDGLRRAIEEPAAAAGLELEPGLAQVVAEDVSGRAAALPLMSHVLSEVWSRRQGRELTLAAYTACGGVEGALARRAEQVYNDLPPGDRALARRTLLRLVSPGEGTEDTRNRVLLAQLVSGDSDAEDLERVLGVLTAARLVSIQGESDNIEVELTHEALLRGWPRFRGWIDEARDDLRRQRQLTTAATEWSRSGDDDLLLGQTRLAVWSGVATDQLTASELEFLSLSRTRADRRAKAAKRRTQIAFGGLSGGLVVVGGLAAFGLVQRNDAASARDDALSRQVAGSAREELGADPELSLLLATRAQSISDTPQAEAALRQAAFQSQVRIRHQTAGSGAGSVAASPDGKSVATADDSGRVDVWDPSTGEASRQLIGNAKSTKVVGLPDGSWVTASAGGTLRLYLAGASRGRVLFRGKPITGLGVGRNGRRYVIGDETGIVRVFDRGNDSPILERRVAESISSVAISPTGTTIAAGAAGKLITIPIAGGATRTLLRTQADESVSGLDFSPDGERLAIATTSGAVIVRDLAGSGLVRLRGHTNRVSSVRFNRDGSKLVTAGAFDNAVRVWSAHGGAALAVLSGHDGGVNDATFVNLDTVLTGATDATARLWDWTAGRPLRIVIPGQIGATTALRIDPRSNQVITMRGDGTVVKIDADSGRATITGRASTNGISVATISPNGETAAFAQLDGVVRVKPLRDGKPPREFTGAKGKDVLSVRLSGDGRSLGVVTGSGDLLLYDVETDTTTKFNHVANDFSALDMTPDGQRLATASSDGTTRIWRPGAAGPLLELSAPLAAYASALSPTEPLVASGGDSRTVSVWNRDTGEAIARLPGHAGPIYGLEFSPDGQRLLSMGSDGTILWDTAAWRPLIRLNSPLGFSGAFGADGRIAVASLAARASSDYAVQIWRCDVCGERSAAAELARSRTTREITDSEADRFLAGLLP